MQGIIRALSIAIEEGPALSITASLGIKLCLPDEESDFDREIKQADEAMYKVKHGGKNGFVIVGGARVSPSD